MPASVDVRRHGGPRLRCPDVDAVCRLYAEGDSLRDIGEAFGVSHMTSRRWLVEAEIPLRAPGWRSVRGNR